MRKRVLLVVSLVVSFCVLSACTPRGGGGGGGGGGDPQLDDTQLQLVLDEVAVLGVYTCSPDAGQTTVQCADYEIAFSLLHLGDDPLVSLDSITVEGGEMRFEDGTDCADRPWLPEVGGAAESGTLGIRYQGEGDIPTLYHRCGTSTAIRTNAAVGDAPVDGSLEVTLEILGTDFVHMTRASGAIEF